MKAEFYYNKRKYICGLFTTESLKELRIRNDKGEVLAVGQGKKIGLQGKKRENSKEVDVSQPYLYNLIKAAVSALEIVEKNQILLEKDQIIDEKDKQLENLNQQLNIINTTQLLSVEQEQNLRQLQNDMQERIAVIEAQNQRIAQLENELRAAPILPSEDIEKKVRTKLGESVWCHLQSSSQRDLCSAYKNYLIIKSERFTAQVADYSEPGRSLGVVVEREIVSPFFTDLYQFVTSYSQSVRLITDVSYEVGGVILKPKGKYTLGNLPGLLSIQWDTFSENALDQKECPSQAKLHRTVFIGNQVNQTDRQLIEQFFKQWKHPLSLWLARGEASASAIDRIRYLRNQAAHPDPMYLWQFKFMWSLVVGGRTSPGVLQEVFASRN